MDGAIKPRHVYVPIICTRTAVEPFAARDLAVVNRKFDSWQTVLELSIVTHIRSQWFVRDSWGI